MTFTEEMINEDEKRWGAREVVIELGYCGNYMRDRKNMTNYDIRFYAYIMRKASYMLKEQEEQIKNRDESIEKAQEEIKWLRGMLKDQEPKKIIRKQMSYEDPDGTITFYAEWHCPHCNKVVKKGFDSPWLKYCFNCGKPILWD